MLPVPPTKASESKNRKSSGRLSRLFVPEPSWNEDIHSEDDGLPTSQDPFLRLDLESVVVLDIKGVQYESARHQVHRHRATGSGRF